MLSLDCLVYIFVWFHYNYYQHTADALLKACTDKCSYLFWTQLSMRYQFNLTKSLTGWLLTVKASRQFCDINFSFSSRSFVALKNYKCWVHELCRRSWILARSSPIVRVSLLYNSLIRNEALTSTGFIQLLITPIWFEVDINKYHFSEICLH